LTYRFVEHPIRFGSFKHSDATIRNLLLTIFTIGIIGAVTWQAKGYPTARTFNTELMRDTEKLDSFRAEQKPCEYAFGKDLNWCITSGKSPTIALYGDSHADHLFPGVVNDKKNSWLLIGHSSCPPLDGIGVRYLDKADECVTRNDQILTTLVSSKIIKTVVLSARGMFYITNKNLMPNARGRNDPANYHLESTHETGTKPELYAKGLERTLTRLEQSGKRVILFMDNPELNFPAIRCIPRPIGLLAPNRATACYMPRKQALAHTAPYREVLTKIAKRHPRVRVYDPTNQLCDESRCYAGNEEMLLYRDANHLSQRGAQKVMADFVKWLNK
ncbi:MAG: SGNH hydrolase domain-containing protein, partial [Rickettsiales bacterium]